MPNWIKQACGLLAVCLLGACGGGGGDGAWAVPGCSAHAPSSNPNAITVTTAPGELAASAAIQFTIDQAGGAPYAAMLSDAPTLVSVRFEVTGPTSGTLILSASGSERPPKFGADGSMLRSDMRV